MPMLPITTKGKGSQWVRSPSIPRANTPPIRPTVLKVNALNSTLVTVVSGNKYLQVPKHVALSDVGYISTLFKNTVSNTRMEQNLPMQTKAET